jgi:imidazole glycerol phosphate synthase subunit HisF
VLKSSSEGVFVPLTIGGGIRDFTDATGTHYSALQVAGEYFRSGADKVSIGSDAVEVALEFRRTGEKSGVSAIEQISAHYGRQAVVISVDPKRVWVADADVESCPHLLVDSERRGPRGESRCWWQCTVKGGRESRPLGAVELAVACSELGAGEILLNNIDNDGAGKVRVLLVNAHVLLRCCRSVWRAGLVARGNGRVWPLWHSSNVIQTLGLSVRWKPHDVHLTITRISRVSVSWLRAVQMC